MAELVGKVAPVSGRARIDVLDVLRGIAILGILYMNIPFMGTSVFPWMDDPRQLSWSAADRATYAFIHVFWDGTQRGLFEMLFGAGLLIFTAKAMKPDDPVAVADLYFRRNLLLCAFGLIDIFIVTWVGDILLCYGLAALIVFAFRKASPKVLLPLGLVWAAVSAVGWSGGMGLVGYTERVELVHAAPALEAAKASGETLSRDDAARLERFAKVRATRVHAATPSAEEQGMAAAEAAARAGGPLTMMPYSWAVWNMVFGDGNELFWSVCEALCGMFIGMALFKWGVIQGARPTRFYAVMALLGYGVGCGLRGLAIAQFYRFDLKPDIGWITGEFARLSVTLGHIGLFNLLMKAGAGAWLLSPFKAAGRMAFSIYVATSVLTIWVLFAPWGPGLYNNLGWAQLMLLATVIDTGMLIAANLWLRRFASGPLEWVWRSLTYGKRQPFRRVVPTDTFGAQALLS